jgi:NAD-dependent dihydropyrimidine dehydrogenase PreA subunit
MAAQINKQACNSCGMCATVCSNGAIRIEAGIAIVEESACTECGVCIDICPLGAIQIAPQPALAMPSVLPKAEESPSRPAPARPNQPAWPAALGSFLGREVLPYVLDGLITTLDRRLASRRTMTLKATNALQETTPFRYGQRRHQRRRARRSA